MTVAASVPGTITVCSSGAAKISSVSRPAMRGARRRSRSLTSSMPAARIPADARAEDAFEVRVDGGEQAADAVAGAGGLGGEVVVV
jgi:hypothetical protein